MITLWDLRFPLCTGLSHHDHSLIMVRFHCAQWNKMINRVTLVIILFHCATGNLTISLSDEMVRLPLRTGNKMIRDEMVRFPLCTGNKMITLWSWLLPLRQWESHQITQRWDLIPFPLCESHHLTLWSSYSLAQWWDLTISLSKGSYSLRSEWGIILFPSHSGNLTIRVISPSHALIILFPSHSGNLTISLSDHLIPFTQW